MWDLPGLGLKPMSPALAGRFLTTAPPGKPLELFITLLFEVGFFHSAQSLLFYLFYFFIEV